MELAVCSAYYMNLSPEEAIARLKKNGIHATELSSEHGEVLLARGDDIKKAGAEFGAYARSIGMQIPQGHLWLNCRLVSNPAAVDILKRWIDLYEAIGIEVMVLHADVYRMSNWSIGMIHEANAEKMRQIADYIRGKKIYICLENLFRRGMDHIDYLLQVLELVGSEQFAITLDTGHLNIVKTMTQREFILTAGTRLRAVHIHDNRGVRDQHLLPNRTGTVNFREVVDALREIGFSGSFSYEILGEGKGPLVLRDLKLRRVIRNYRSLMGETK